MNPDTEQELRDAQKAVAITTAAAEHARQLRRDAVMRARSQDVSKYAIAGVLGVRPTTVDSIIATAERQQADQ